MVVDIDLSGSAVIVTGGGSGIGRGIALRLADAGADIVIAARTVSELEETKALVEERGSDALVVETDLRKEGDIERLVEAAFDEFDHTRILVNNAALNHIVHPSEMTAKQVDEMNDVNFRAVFLLSRTFAGRLVDRSETTGRIINISSGSAEFGYPDMTVYGGTKAGINGLTRGLAATFVREGVNVNSVTPGLTQVGRVDEILEESEMHNVDGIPKERLASPEDIGNACLYLCSEMGEYVTGEVLHVDGGVQFMTSHFHPPW